MSWSLSFSAKASEVRSILEKMSAQYANPERDAHTASVIAVAERAPKGSIVVVEGQGSEGYHTNPYMQGMKQCDCQLNIRVFAAAPPESATAQAS
ncbi:MAG TPA: hypothetical protein VKQ28_16735 [Candidatus Acidoferrum sp.]|nr:hypothetical protein [Candidatus Acidoferrum sp.]